ncbi:MAG: ABC transporter ATP-binding protein [Saprospiraceae bacterium]|nr:ABC transporter ATP-binding protein [Saprospiraceae bacterium]
MIVELKNICKTYENESGVKREVLNEISLNIKSSDSIAIVGPSGCGKSTLLNIIGTLDLPTSGTVIFKGNEVQNLSENQLAEIRNENIGFVFQQHHLLPQLNLLENVLLPLIPLKDKNKKKTAQARAMELLQSIGLKEKIHQRPGQMSVGECQRAAVVRALINQPDLILADEPTGSLDQESAEQMGNLLSEIHKKQNVALIVVTHSMELANKMDAVFKLVNGQLVIVK